MNALRVAAVGVWHVHAGEYVDEMLENPAFDVVGVFDEDGEAAAAFAEARNLPVIDSFAEAIGDSVDAIVVDTATSEHARVIGAALAAGKHVFTEKVLASDLATACALEEQAAEAGKCLFVSLQRLAEPWIYEMIEVIRSGQIGDITSSRFRYQHGGVVEGWLPAAFLNADEAQGGSIIDLGAHGYYLSNLFHDAFPESVTSVGSYVTGAAVEDHSVVVLSYPGGRTSVLETSLVAGPYSRWCEVYGTTGFAVVDSRDDQVRVRVNSNDDDAATWAVRENGPRRATPLVRWLEAINTGVRDEDNVRAALRLTAQVEASYAAMKQRASVEVADPA